MLADEREIFESHFGFPFPNALSDLLGDETLKVSMPVVYRFPNKQFVLEIEYLLNIGDLKYYDITNNRLAFAVTTDGYQLLVDLSTNNLEILQNESGDIDYLDITIKDLLNAERASL